jgi:cation diffusion facilitator family transporter
MRYLADMTARKITQGKDLLEPEERFRVGLIESWVSIVANILLTLLKIIFGLLTNSIALFADAVHSASDIFSSLIVLIGFSLGRREPDQEHPHGHGRSEYLAGLAIAIMLIGAGAAFAYSAYNRLVGEVFARPSVTAIVAIVFSILVKEYLYFFSAKLGTLIDSEALAGDAWHHRSDSLSSVLVLVALIGAYFGTPSLDAYLGFGVALFVIYAGIKIARNSCSRLIGAAPSEDMKNGVTECALKVNGVIETHDLEIHDYGSRKVVTIHIEVHGHLSLDEAHHIANQVEEKISNCYHCSTVVHLDPR